nr:FecR domain-containing protein [uncultured Carboxylicivirga sp.]
MSKPIPYNIIIASLEESITDDEKLDLKKWLEESDNHHEIYSSIAKTWHKTRLKQSNFNPNTKLALSVTKARINRRLFIKRTASIAAILIIGLSITFLLNLIDNTNNWQSVVAQKQEKITLPDSTVVVLSEGSTILFPKTFENKNRRVKLNGKAYFEVTHNKNKPFIVETNLSQTKVLGTKFTLNTQAKKQDVLYLDEGKVEFSSLSWFGPKQIVHPGEKVSLTEGKLTTNVAINDNLSSWATGKLVYRDISLSDLIKQLEAYYHTHILLASPKLNELHFSGTITQSSAEEALHIIALTLQLRLSTNNQTLTLSL